MQAIGVCFLTLSYIFVLKLDRAFYVQSLSQNLISISKLVPLEYSFNFSNMSFGLLHNSNYVGNGILFDGFYRIDFQNNITYNLLHVHKGINSVILMKTHLCCGTKDYKISL